MSTAQQYKVVIEIDSYIGKPYWPEANAVIDIEKKSGTNRARSEDKKEAALLNFLKKEGLTVQHYQNLKVKAQRPWYRVDNDEPTSEIVIPRHHISGMLVNAAKSAPAGAKLDPEDLRARIKISDFKTGKTKADELFERFIKSDQTNQRRFTSDEVLKSFQAEGTFSFNPSATKLTSVQSLLSHALEHAGIGSARKMGYGRGQLISITPIKVE